MSRLDLSLCWAILAKKDIAAARDLGLQPEMLRGEAQKVYDQILSHFRAYGVVPSKDTVLEDVELHPEDVFDPDEPIDYYAKKVIERECLNAQRTAAKDLGQALRSRDPAKVHEAAKSVVQVGLDRTGIAPGRVVNQADNAEERWNRYLQLENSDGGLRGMRTPWREMDDETGGFKAGDLWTFVGRVGLGKCVAAGTLLTDPVSGARSPVEDVVRSKADVLTFDPNTPQVRGVTPAAWLATGTKKCLRVETRLGESIVVTPEHPFLTSRGWKRADELACGERVVCLARIPEPRKTEERDPSEVVLVAVLLSEGSYSGNHVSFSTADPHYAAYVKEHAKKLGLVVKRTGKYDYALVGGARKLLRKYGLKPEKAKHKRIPAAIFALPNTQLALFIRIFWWGDGGVDGEVCLASEGLISDLKHLLLRFGVVCKKIYKRALCRGKAFDAWRLRTDGWCRHRLGDVLRGIPGKKGTKLQRNLTETIQATTDVVDVSKELLEGIEAAASVYRRWSCPAHERRGLFSDTAARLSGRKKKWSLRDFVRRNGKNSTSRRLLRGLIDTAYPALEAFRWLVSDDIVFDKVTRVSKDALRPVYDLTIDGSHAFEAEHFVVHNTWCAVLSAVVAGSQNQRIGFVSPEMSRPAIELRRDAVKYKLPYRHLLRGQLDYEMKEHYRRALFESPREADWLIAAEGRVNTVADADLFLQETKVSFLVVDGMYLLRSGNDKMAWHERIMLIAKGLKEVALTRKVPILATAQFNRSVRTGAMRAGTEAIGHTDAIGQFSDVVVGLFQNEELRNNRQMMLRHLKNREGPPIEMRISWDLELMDFSTIAVEGGQAGPHDAPDGGGGTDGTSLFH